MNGYKKNKPLIPMWFIIIYRVIRHSSYFKTHLNFLFGSFPNKSSFVEKLMVIKKIHAISYEVESASSEYEVIRFINDFMKISPLVEGKIAEIGCYKGGSSCKFSIASAIVNRKFVLFDSFEGIPENSEMNDYNIHGNDKVFFPKGSYEGTLDEVKNNIYKWGNPQVCEYVKGFVEDTLPNNEDKFCAVYIDVDLASATKTCLKYLYPRLSRGGVLYSQDGHLPLVIEVFEDEKFWINEVGCPKPFIEGVGSQKLIRILKE